MLGSDREFLTTYLTQRSFFPLVGPLELALQLAWAHTTSTAPQDQLTLGGDNLDPFVYNQKVGGLLNLRGFPPTLLHGRSIAFTNLEARLTLTEHLPLGPAGRVALQLAGFVDAGRVFDGLSPLGPGQTALSAGGGLLCSLRDFRYAFLNWYVARTVLPYPETRLDVLITRPFF